MPPTSPMAVISESAAAQLLDFSQRLDIGLLDRVVNCMYHEAGDQQKIAEKVLNTLKEHPDAWMRVDSILEFSSNQETKYFALQILEALIKTRWKVLARPQCEGIKKYIVGLIIQTGNLTLQSSLLAYMFKIVENDIITVPLSDAPESTTIQGSKANVQYVHQSLSQLLKQVFPHLQETQIRVFIDGLFSFDQDVAAFREHVRDFLVQIREVAGEDLSDLYLEEREAEIAQAQAAKLRRHACVPGILGPHEVDMCD